MEEVGNQMVHLLQAIEESAKKFNMFFYSKCVLYNLIIGSLSEGTQ